jgi:hypothetical protein
MPNAADWVPVRFPAEAGPEWLSLLKGSPFNALLVAETGGEKRLVEAARAAGLDVVPANGTPEPVMLIKDAVWPHIQVQQRGSGEAGPTGSPWLDSNGWLIQLWQARTPGWIMWPMAEPPAQTTLRTEHHLIAIADSAMYGARFPVTVRRDAAEWKQICDAVRFFESRRNDALKPVARLGICSTFSGPSQDLGQEALNLASRRLLPYRVLDRDKVTAERLQGLKAVLWIDEKLPSQALRKFVSEGGLLIVPANAADIGNGLKPVSSRQADGYVSYASGSGRIAVARKPWTDPFLLAEEAHMLLSRSHDVIRLWNAGAVMARYLEDGSGRGRAELVNFTGRAMGHPMSMWVAKTYRSGRCTVLGGGEPKTLALTPRSGGTEVHLPAFDVYAAVDFES